MSNKKIIRKKWKQINKHNQKMQFARWLAVIFRVEDARGRYKVIQSYPHYIMGVVINGDEPEVIRDVNNQVIHFPRNRGKTDLVKRIRFNERKSL